jgi:hypothetical protein
VLVVVVVAVLVLTADCSPPLLSREQLGIPILAMLTCLYILMLLLFIFFLHWIVVISQYHISQ